MTKTAEADFFHHSIHTSLTLSLLHVRLSQGRCVRNFSIISQGAKLRNSGILCSLRPSLMVCAGQDGKCHADTNIPSVAAEGRTFLPWKIVSPSPKKCHGESPVTPKRCVHFPRISSESFVVIYYDCHKSCRQYILKFEVSKKSTYLIFLFQFRIN